MANRDDIDSFLAHACVLPIIDVRSPGEFSQGHMPGAFNVPLFDDLERSRVGTIYKTDGRDEAVLTGLEIVGPKMRGFVESIKLCLDEYFATHKVSLGSGPSLSGEIQGTPSVQMSRSHPKVCLYCWRGGMRSASVGWLLEQAGITSVVLEGGYKAFRQHAQRRFAVPRPVFVLSGMTGAGKTRMLAEIAELGEQVVDLEDLANHRGSSFGGIGLPEQPTGEQFENELFWQLNQLDSRRPVWVEDESMSVGRVRVPDPLWWHMRRSPAIFLDVDRDRRAKNLALEYGLLDPLELISATQRLAKKLGGLRTQEVVQMIEQQQYESVALLLLEYYDKSYEHAAKKRPRKEVHRVSGQLTARQLIDFSRKMQTC